MTVIPVRTRRASLDLGLMMTCELFGQGEMSEAGYGYVVGLHEARSSKAALVWVISRHEEIRAVDLLSDGRM